MGNPGLCNVEAGSNKATGSSPWENRLARWLVHSDWAPCGSAPVRREGTESGFCKSTDKGGCANICRLFAPGVRLTLGCSSADGCSNQVGGTLGQGGEGCCLAEYTWLGAAQSFEKAGGLSFQGMLGVFLQARV